MLNSIRTNVTLSENNSRLQRGYSKVPEEMTRVCIINRITRYIAAIGDITLSSHQDLKKNILIVDDEPDMTRMLKMSLKREGLLIDAFNDPVLARENFEPNIYDLVILDVRMPKMDGFDLHSKLKKIDHNIKICFLTASTETYREELIKQKHHKIDKKLFWEMPLPIKEIISRIKKQIGLS